MSQWIDQGHLNEFTGGDRQLTHDVLRTFQANVPVYFEDLRRATQPDDFRARAHRLKGAARAVGAKPLAELAYKAEKNHDADGTKRQRILGELERHITQTLQQVEDILSQ